MDFTNKIIQGDSLQILKEMKSNSVDLVITSPPYFQQRDYGNGNTGIGNEETEKQYLDNLLAIFFESVRVTKPTGAIVYNLGDKYINGGLSLLPYKFAIQAIETNKVFLINDITWSKLNPTPRQDRRKLIQATEPFFVFAKSKEYKFNLDDYLQHLDNLNKRNGNNPNTKIGEKYFELIDNAELTETEKNNAKKELNLAIQSVISGEINSFRMKIRGLHKLAYGGQAGGRNNQINNNGYSIIKITGNKLKKDIIESPVEITKNNSHPAVYPIYIIQELIKLLTNKGDIVLDPFNGSGTTCVAAKNLGRRYIGIEINPDYVELANQRIKENNFHYELLL
jgi:site-specific DNA-methyltransferase (adenine-specific)